MGFIDLMCGCKVKIKLYLEKYLVYGKIIELQVKFIFDFTLGLNTRMYKISPSAGPLMQKLLISPYSYSYYSYDFLVSKGYSKI